MYRWSEFQGYHFTGGTEKNLIECHILFQMHIFTWYISAKRLSLPTPRSTGYQSTAARWQKRVFTVTSDNGSHLGSVQHGSKHSRSNYGDKDISLADFFFSSKKKKCVCVTGFDCGFWQTVWRHADFFQFGCYRILLVFLLEIIGKDRN